MFKDFMNHLVTQFFTAPFGVVILLYQELGWKKATLIIACPVLIIIVTVAMIFDWLVF